MQRNISDLKNLLSLVFPVLFFQIPDSGFRFPVPIPDSMF